MEQDSVAGLSRLGKFLKLVVDYNRSVKSISMQLGLFALFVCFLLRLLCLGLNAAGAVLFILEKFYEG